MRRRSVAASSLVWSTSAASWTRSTASAVWSSSASSSRRSAGVSSGPARSFLMPDDAELAAAGAQGQEEARRAGQVVRAAAGRRVVAPAPFGGCEVVVVELVLGRVGRHQHQPAVLGQEEHHLGLEHQRHLMRRGPEQIVDRSDTGELLREAVERRGASGCLGGRPRSGHGCAPRARWRSAPRSRTAAGRRRSPAPRSAACRAAARKKKL